MENPDDTCSEAQPVPEQGTGPVTPDPLEPPGDAARVQAPLLGPSRRYWVLPLVLFVLTCFSTAWVHGLGTAVRLLWIVLLQEGVIVPHELIAAAVVRGLSYAIPVMVILLAHELGHYLQARRYGVPASLPFFIPMPFSPTGTMGAVIAMRPNVADRRALFDIAITGPLAGLVPAVVLSVVGLYKSRVIDVQNWHGLMRAIQFCSNCLSVGFSGRWQKDRTSACIPLRSPAGWAFSSPR